MNTDILHNILIVQMGMNCAKKSGPTIDHNTTRFGESIWQSELGDYRK